VTHKCLGPLHYGALSLLKNMVQGLPDFKIEQIDMCKGCALNKHSKTIFPSNKQRSIEILKLIQSIVCKSVSSSSLKGNLYYVSFIDDSS